MGRPSRYETEIKPHIKEIKKAVENGATVEEIAAAYKIAVSTLHRYKAENKDLQEAFTRGHEKVIIKIKAALLKKALGFKYEEEKCVARKDKYGDNIVLVEKYKRYSPPSETAAAMLLRNYDETWRDNDNASARLRQQEADLRKEIAKANNFGLEV